MKTKESPTLTPKSFARALARQLKPQAKAHILTALGYLLGQKGSDKRNNPEKYLDWEDKILKQNKLGFDDDERDEMEKELYKLLTEEQEEAKNDLAEGKRIYNISQETDERIRELLGKEDGLSNEENAELILLQLKKQPEIEKLVGHLLRQSYEGHNIDKILKKADTKLLKDAERIVKRLTLIRKGKVGELVHKALNRVSVDKALIPNSSEEWPVLTSKDEIRTRADIDAIPTEDLPQIQVAQKTNAGAKTITKKPAEQHVLRLEQLANMIASMSDKLEGKSPEKMASVIENLPEGFQQATFTLQKTHERGPHLHEVKDQLVKLSTNLMLFANNIDDFQIQNRIDQLNAECVILIKEVTRIIDETEVHADIPLKVKITKKSGEPIKNLTPAESIPQKSSAQLPSQPMSPVPKRPEPLDIPKPQVPTGLERADKNIEKSKNKKVFDNLFSPSVENSRKTGILMKHPSGAIDEVLAYDKENDRLIVKRFNVNGTLQFGALSKHKLEPRLEKITFLRTQALSFEYLHNYQDPQDQIPVDELHPGDVIECTTKDGIYQFEILEKAENGAPFVKLIHEPVNSELSKNPQIKLGLPLLKSSISPKLSLLFNGKDTPQIKQILSVKISPSTGKTPASANQKSAA